MFILFNIVDCTIICFSFCLCIVYYHNFIWLYLCKFIGNPFLNQIPPCDADNPVTYFLLSVITKMIERRDVTDRNPCSTEPFPGDSSTA